MARGCPRRGKGKGGKGKDGGGKGGFKGKGKDGGKGWSGRPGGGKVGGKGGGKSSGYQGQCWRCWKIGHKAAECTMNLVDDEGGNGEDDEGQNDEVGGVWTVGNVNVVSEEVVGGSDDEPRVEAPPALCDGVCACWKIGARRRKERRRGKTMMKIAEDQVVDEKVEHVAMEEA